MNGYEWKEVDGGLEYRRESWPFTKARVHKDLHRGWTFQITATIGGESVYITSATTISGNDDLRQARVKDAEAVLKQLEKLDE